MKTDEGERSPERPRWLETMHIADVAATARAVIGEDCIEAVLAAASDDAA